MFGFLPSTEARSGGGRRAVSILGLLRQHVVRGPAERHLPMRVQRIGVPRALPRLVQSLGQVHGEPLGARLVLRQVPPRVSGGSPLHRDDSR